jgi:NAD(P)-dependent dehydrogenase (short-subunit alcohol dehydrogenase family)
VSKTALITGASGGLGQALAKKLRLDGWALIVVGRDANKLQAAYAHEHTQIVADCSTTHGVSDIFETIKTMHLAPTVLAHCVGNIKLGALHRMKEADFNECMQANLFSAFHTLAGFTNYLKQSKLSGSAVFVSSAAAQIGTPNHEAVGAAKAGLEGLVRSAAATYASVGVRINAVAPGVLDTPASATLLSSALFREVAAKQYPIVGIGDPSEVADLMAWLISDAAARVTGQVWSIDGGFANIRPLVK